MGYAIGRAEPVSVRVDTFGTGDAREAEAYVRRDDRRVLALHEDGDARRRGAARASDAGGRVGMHGRRAARLTTQTVMRHAGADR